MDGTFDKKDAKKILKEQQSVLARMSVAELNYTEYRMQVKTRAEELVKKEALKLLGTISIEEINKGKRGFRVKTLRENGFETLADIADADSGRIAAVHGVGDETAKQIREVVDEIVGGVSTGVKIRLSADDRSQEATQLLVALYRCRKMKALVEDTRNFLLVYHDTLEVALQDLHGALGPFRWMFASKAKKQKAQGAYFYLDGLRKDGTLQQANILAGQLEEVEKATGETAWQEFQENSIGLIHELEDLCPGILGNDDGVYGLPEELAKEIREESYSTEGLNCELRRYQEWGVKYILHQERVLLGDEMGLGKTVQAIAAMVALRNRGCEHFLVVCPASIVTNWCREIRKMSNLQAFKIHGSERNNALAEWMLAGGVAVTTYELLGTFVLPLEFRLPLLIVDEAHYIKNPEARRSQKVRELCERADRLLFMTGTALENNADEMVELIKVLRPDIGEEIQGMTYMPAAPLFRQAVIPVYYRRKRDAVLTELPDLIEKEEWCTMEAVETAVYEQAVLDHNVALSRRVSWNVENLSDSSKAMHLKALVEQAKEEGRKVLVFSFYLDTLRKVTELLGECCMPPIDGLVPPQARQDIIDVFEKGPAGTVLPAQIQTGGTGLNIQAASVVILCEPQLKPSVENQAIARAYRMGQTRNVLVFRLLADETIDERILERLKEKQAVFDAFADQSDAAAGSLELDEKTLGMIIQEEAERIQAGK